MNPPKQNVLQSSAGNLLVELALVIPFFLGISLVGLEYARSIRQTHIGVSLGRELANLAFRNCSALDAGACSDCLSEQVLQPLSDFAQGLVQGASLSVRIEHFDTTGNQLYSCTAGGLNPPRYSFDQNGVLIGPNYTITKETLGKHEVIVIAETEIPFRPLLQGVGGIDIGEMPLYESAVF